MVTYSNMMEQRLMQEEKEALSMGLAEERIWQVKEMKKYHSVQARISGSCCLTELCLLVHNNLEKAGGGCLLEQAGQLGQVGHGDIDQVGLVVLAQVLDV